jgi:chromosome segregation ATPase
MRPGDEAPLDNSNLKWARHLAAQAWCDSVTSSIEMDSRLAEAFARILTETIETPEALERSELYCQRMAAICTAALGYAPGQKGQEDQGMATEYHTPAFRDVVRLYKQYAHYFESSRDLAKRNESLERRIRELQDTLQDIRERDYQASGHASEETVAQAFIDRDRDQAVNGIEFYRKRHVEQQKRIAELSKAHSNNHDELVKWFNLAKKHGWSYSEHSPVALDEVSRWLDLFVDLTNQHHELGQKWETQKGSLQYLQELVDDKDKTIAKLTDRIQRADSRIIKLKNLL